MNYAKLTKAELVARLRETDNRPPADWADVARLLAHTAATVRRELPLLVKDCYAFGRWTRGLANVVIEEVRKPVLIR